VTYHFELDMVSFPLISIIMPVRNEAAFIARSLDVLFAQDYPTELMEFLIGDGMSSDNTRSIIAHFTDLHPEVKIQILDNPSQIVPTAMNLALRRAKGDIIIRVDGHTIIAPDYVRQCVEALQRTNADNVGGKMNAIGKNPFGKAVALAILIPKNGWIQFTWVPGRDGSLRKLACSMKNWCVTRMTNSIIVCANMAEKFYFARKSNPNIVCVVRHVLCGDNTINMVSGKCVYCKNIRAR
jgi:glycosyltransferase involved in cell wall biosynthesis